MLEALIDRFGDGPVLFAGGLVVGVVFGVSAQHSRFCLRAAAVEFAERRVGERMAIWLLAFFAAVVAVQAGVLTGLIAPAETRQIAATGSLSGALIGGLMFGSGMILARGCASRLLVLSASGNLRALVTGLIVTIVAQASLRGGLSGARAQIAGIWTVDGGAGRDLLALIGVGPNQALFAGAVSLLGALLFAVKLSVLPGRVLSAIGVGAAIAMGWAFTFAMSRVSFEPIQPGSVTFTGPSADTLMGLINMPTLPMGFSEGLVPGVFAGAMVMSLISRSWTLQGFDGGRSMLRYFTGAGLMGFGAMLAGGCAVGAGVTGGSVFALTAWVALTAIWIGAAGMHALDKAWTLRLLAKTAGRAATDPS